VDRWSKIGSRGKCKKEGRVERIPTKALVLPVRYITLKTKNGSGKEGENGGRGDGVARQQANFYSQLELEIPRQKI